MTFLLTPLFFLSSSPLSFLIAYCFARNPRDSVFHLQLHPWTFQELFCWFHLEYLKDDFVGNSKCRILLGRHPKWFCRNLQFESHSKGCLCLWTTYLPLIRNFSSCNYNENHTSRSLTNPECSYRDRLVCWRLIRFFFHMHCNKIFVKYCAVIKIWFCNTFFQWFLVVDQSNIHPVADVFHRLAKDAVVHEFEKINSFCALARRFVFKSMYGLSHAFSLNAIPRWIFVGPFHVNSQQVVRSPSPIFLKFYSNCHYPIWWTSAKFEWNLWRNGMSIKLFSWGCLAGGGLKLFIFGHVQSPITAKLH